MWNGGSKNNCRREGKIKLATKNLRARGEGLERGGRGVEMLTLRQYKEESLRVTSVS